MSIPRHPSTSAQDTPERADSRAATTTTPPSVGRRLFWLLACVAGGSGVGWLGFHFTADQKWFLAVPAAIALGWLFFADPTECLLPKTRGR